MRVVLDTNVLVSALVFHAGVSAWVREGWIGRRFEPLIDGPCARELVRVLGYPKFGLDREEIEALLGEYLPYATTVVHGKTRRDVPSCRDPDDRKFLVLAAHGEARVLVTGDRALLDLEGRTNFAIETPAQFRARWRG